MVGTSGAFVVSLAAGGISSRDAREHRESGRDVVGLQGVLARDELHDLQILLGVPEPLTGVGCVAWAQASVLRHSATHRARPNNSRSEIPARSMASPRSSSNTGGFSSSVCSMSCSAKSMIL